MQISFFLFYKGGMCSFRAVSLLIATHNQVMKYKCVRVHSCSNPWRCSISKVMDGLDNVNNLNGILAPRTCQMLVSAGILCLWWRCWWAPKRRFYLSESCGLVMLGRICVASASKRYLWEWCWYRRERSRARNDSCVAPAHPNSAPLFLDLKNRPKGPWGDLPETTYAPIIAHCTCAFVYIFMARSHMTHVTWLKYGCQG